MTMQIAVSMKNAIFAPRSRSVESFNHDGMELARRRRHRRVLPIRQILQFALAVLAFKIFLFIQIGAVAYNGKMAELSEGNMLERAAAAIMVLDPVSKGVVTAIRR